MNPHARCEIDGCHGRASVHVLTPRRRVCAACATELRFPRVKAMLDMVAVAEVLRQAATDLDELAGAAPLYELGTLRRKGRAIVLGALGCAEGFSAAGGEGLRRPQ